MNLLLVFHISPFKWTAERYVPEGSIGATQLRTATICCLLREQNAEIWTSQHTELSYRR
jgi:hypothetical protein